MHRAPRRSLQWTKNEDRRDKQIDQTEDLYLDYKRTLKTPWQQHKPHQKWAKDLNRLFTKEGIQVVDKYMRWCSASGVTGDTQFKITVRNTPTRTATIKQADQTKYRPWWGEPGLTRCWWERETAAGKSLVVSGQLYIRLTYHRSQQPHS